MSSYTWQWPTIGPTAINEGLDSEVFDTKEVPHSHTFVREAIQNSLDARLDKTEPVTVRFSFRESELGDRRHFLSDLKEKKETCGLEWPEEWSKGRISWLLIEDFNTTGLEGDLEKRSGDFWNYWLNFGISNKPGTGRGGRGIGRVTFLIASRIHTVIGLTRRVSDGAVVGCGMGVMRLFEDGEDFRSGYAYLAESEKKNTFELYHGDEFARRLIIGFATVDRVEPSNPGFSLAIPYPHQELTRENIKAAVIEHFGPAIIEGHLVVLVDDEKIDPDSIDNVAFAVTSSFQTEALKQSPIRVLDLERRAVEEADFEIEVTDLSSFAANLTTELHESLRDHFESARRVVLDLRVSVERNGRRTFGSMRAVLARTPNDVPPADFFFRGGMCLPKTRARRPSDIDLVLQTIGTTELVTYLNFCEGKAHLDLDENHEVTAKLAKHGFTQRYHLKRFIRRLMEELRSAVLPDATKPDASVFARYFSAPNVATPAGERRTKPKRNRNIVIVDPPPARVPAFVVTPLADDGFRVAANPAFQNWPVNATITLAYADGSRRPKWSPFDFQLRQLAINYAGSSEPVLKNNTINLKNCDPTIELEVRGFDKRRELVTNIESRRVAGLTTEGAPNA